MRGISGRIKPKLHSLSFELYLLGKDGTLSLKLEIMLYVITEHLFFQLARFIVFCGTGIATQFSTFDLL